MGLGEGTMPSTGSRKSSGEKLAYGSGGKSYTVRPQETEGDTAIAPRPLIFPMGSEATPTQPAAPGSQSQGPQRTSSPLWSGPGLKKGKVSIRVGSGHLPTSHWR